MLLRQGYLAYIKWWPLSWELVFLNLKKIKDYAKYKNHLNDFFRDTLLKELSQVWINNDDDGLNNFLRIFGTTLDRFGPCKKAHQE